MTEDVLHGAITRPATIPAEPWKTNQKTNDKLRVCLAVLLADRKAFSPPNGARKSSFTKDFGTQATPRRLLIGPVLSDPG